MNWHHRLDSVLRSWEGTPYIANQRLKKIGADCVGFVDGVLRELYRLNLPPLPPLPQNISLHDQEGSFRIMRELMRRYPHETIEGGEPEAGDVLIYKRGLGPGHVAIIGADPRMTWHTTLRSVVCYTSTANILKHIIIRFRMKDKETWQQS